jgi:hypothetical protein
MNRAEAGQLLGRYLQGDLSPGEQEQLTEALLSGQDLFNAFAEEAIFEEFLGQADFRARVEAAIRPPTAAARFAGFFKNLNAGWRWAGAAAVVALALLAAVVLYRGGSHTDQNQSASSRSPAPLPAVLTVVLTPTERGSGAPQIAIANYEIVRLRMNVPQGSYTSYRAVLKAIDGPFERAFAGLTPSPGPAGRPQLQVETPANQLRPGEYTLELLGVTSAGSAEPAAGYGFLVK